MYGDGQKNKLVNDTITLTKQQSSYSNDMTQTFEMLNTMQVPKNHQGLIYELPIHFFNGEAELYKEYRDGSLISFKPVKEFISLKPNKVSAKEGSETKEKEQGNETIDHLFKRLNVAGQAPLLLCPNFKMIDFTYDVKPAVFKGFKKPDTESIPVLE